MEGIKSHLTEPLKGSRRNPSRSSRQSTSRECWGVDSFLARSGDVGREATTCVLRYRPAVGRSSSRANKNYVSSIIASLDVPNQSQPNFESQISWQVEHCMTTQRRKVAYGCEQALSFIKSDKDSPLYHQPGEYNMRQHFRHKFSS